MKIIESSLTDLSVNEKLNETSKMFAPPWLCSKTINMLFAPPGAGKSHWAFNLSLAIAGGTTWLGKQCLKSKVLYIDGEMGGAAWVRRLPGNFITGEFEENFRMLSPDNFSNGSVPPLSDRSNHGFWLEKSSHYDVIFIDNYITCCLPTTGEDSDIGLFLVLKDLLVKLKRMGKAVVLIHHTNKGGTDQHGTIYKDVIMDTIFRLRKWPRQYLENGLAWEVKVFKDRNNFFEKKEEMMIDINFSQSGIHVSEGDINHCRRVLASELLDKGYNKNNIADELKISINKVLDILNSIKHERRAMPDDLFDDTI